MTWRVIIILEPTLSLILKTHQFTNLKYWLLSNLFLLYFRRPECNVCQSYVNVVIKRDLCSLYVLVPWKPFLHSTRLPTVTLFSIYVQPENAINLEQHLSTSRTIKDC